MTRQKKDIDASARQLRRAGLNPDVVRKLGIGEYDDSQENWRANMEKAGIRYRPGDGPPVIMVDPAPPGDAEVAYDESYGLDTYDGMMVCDICNVPLNRLTEVGDEQNVSWIHTRNWRHYDHDPVPRRTHKDERPDAVCDFCGVGQQLHWAYAGDRLRIGGGNAVHDYGTVWTSCAECAPFIDDRDLDGLMRRALRVSPSMERASGLEKRTTAMGWMSLWETFVPTIHTRRYIGPRREPTRLNPKMMPKIQAGLIKFWSHPNITQLLCSDERTVGLSMPGVHVGHEEIFRVRFNAHQPIPPQAAQDHANHLAAGIAVSELYWISEDFTRLAIMAGKDMDKIHLSREELPKPFGFMMFAEAIGEVVRPDGNAAIRGVSWTLVPEGVWLNLYVQSEDGDNSIDPIEVRQKFGYLVCPNTGAGIPFGEDVAYNDIEPGKTNFLYTILSTWFLLVQPGVAEVTNAPVDKKLARAYKRDHNRALPSVQLVDLRRRPRRASDDAPREGTPLKYRVFRKGHWKRQHYGPKRALRKTIYISPYIAGPENAPLYEKPATVKILR